MLHLSRSRCVPSLALLVASCLVFSGCGPGTSGPTGSTSPVGPSESPQASSPGPSGVPIPTISPGASPTAPATGFTQWQQLDFPEPLPHVYGGSDVAAAAKAGDLYVAVGSVNGGCCDGAFSTDSHGVVWRSTDGVTWTLEARTAVFDLAHLRGLASDGHRLVAIGTTITDDAGQAAHHGAVWVSDDGRDWARQAVVPEFVAVAATASGFVAAADGSDGPEVWSSPDGLAWSIVATSTVLGQGQVRAMAATPVGVVAVGSGSPADASSQTAAAWRSADGTHWTRATAQPWFSNASMDDIAVSGSAIVASGNDVGTGAAVWRSVDGLAWTRVLSGPLAVAGTSILGIVAGRSGFIVAGSIEGNIPGRVAWQSTTGTDWSELDAPADLKVDRLTGIQAGDSLVVFTRAFDEHLGRALARVWAVR